MKKQARRDARPSRPPVALDRAALERITAGHKAIDPLAGSFRAFQPDDIASSDD
jgi:hypothetical protein